MCGDEEIWVWVGAAQYGVRMIELCTYTLCNSISQCHPNKFNFKVKE